MSTGTKHPHRRPWMLCRLLSCAAEATSSITKAGKCTCIKINLSNENLLLKISLWTQQNEKIEPTKVAYLDPFPSIWYSSLRFQKRR